MSKVERQIDRDAQGKQDSYGDSRNINDIGHNNCACFLVNGEDTNVQLGNVKNASKKLTGKINKYV